MIVNGSFDSPAGWSIVGNALISNGAGWVGAYDGLGGVIYQDFFSVRDVSYTISGDLASTGRGAAWTVRMRVRVLDIVTGGVLFFQEYYGSPPLPFQGRL